MMVNKTAWNDILIAKCDFVIFVFSKPLSNSKLKVYFCVAFFLLKYIFICVLGKRSYFTLKEGEEKKENFAVRLQSWT